MPALVALAYLGWKRRRRSQNKKQKNKKKEKEEEEKEKGAGRRMSRKNYEDKEEEEEGEEEQEEGEEEEEEGGKRKEREKKEGQEEDEEKRKKEKREEKTKKMNDVFLLPCIRVFDQENNSVPRAIPLMSIGEAVQENAPLGCTVHLWRGLKIQAWGCEALSFLWHLLFLISRKSTTTSKDCSKLKMG